MGTKENKLDQHFQVKPEVLNLWVVGPFSMGHFSHLQMKFLSSSTHPNTDRRTEVLSTFMLFWEFVEVFVSHKTTVNGNLASKKMSPYFSSEVIQVSFSLHIPRCFEKYITKLCFGFVCSALLSLWCCMKMDGLAGS